ncbi:hypothetical protein GCM10025857_34300 [Alicyclobacillus contaminans]|nr:hypothetical protein GCM10025857_34300 [Alicyclobacillus contaminans]
MSLSTGSDSLRVVWPDPSGVQFYSMPYDSPPNAPILSPMPNFDATTAQTLSWTFSDPDSGDSQSAYQLQIVDVSSGQTVVDTGKVASTAQSYQLAANTLQNGKQYQWRVTTWDRAQKQSPWSSYGIFATAAAPLVEITSPSEGQVLDSGSVTAQWSYSDPYDYAQATYQVILQDANGGTLWDSGMQNDPIGLARALTIGYNLQNNTTYKMLVKVTNSKGLAATSATVTFATSFTSPQTPDVTATPEPMWARIALAITNPAPVDGEPQVVYNDIYRRPTGTTSWQRIATNVPASGTYDDYAVASGQSYDYKVTAVGANGATADSQAVTASVTFSGIWLHDPQAPDSTIRNWHLREQQRTLQTQYTQTMVQFEGRPLPVADIADQKTQQVQVTVNCRSGTDDLTALYALIDSQTTLLYRDSRGRKIYGVVAAIPETENFWGSAAQLTIQAVDYQEVV